MTTPTFRAGDTVAIAYNGVARNGSDNGYTTLDIPGGSICLSLSAASDVTVVQKRSPQVGDTLLGSDLSSLPGLRTGTVLRSSSSNEVWLRTANGWHSSLDASSPGPAVAGDSYTILALPV